MAVYRLIPGVIVVVALLAGCAAKPTAGPGLPQAVGNGHGSEFGNYGAQEDGEFKGERGERCVAFNWDRPIGDGLAIRIRSASCESAERPGWMVCHDISRTVIPIAESNLAKERE